MKAVNPQTGDEVELINGKWVPVRSAVMSNRVADTIGQKAKQAREFSFKTMVGNIPSSAGQMASDVWSAATSPIETAKTLGKTAIGAGQMLIPGEQQYEPYAQAVGQHMSDRYGGMPEFKETLMTDPVGVLGDTAGLLSGAGMLPKMGQVGRIGSMIDPVNLATRGASKGMMQAAPNLPSNLYQGAAKFYKKYDAPVLAERALEYGIMPTEGGLKKIQDINNSIDDQIDGLIEQANTSGQRINKQSLYKYVDGVREQLGGVNIKATANLDAINKVVNDFDDHLVKIGKQNLTPEEVQKFKRDVYNEINYDAGKQKGSRAAEETYKATARAAKDELENIIPEIKDLNLEWGNMLELAEALEGPAARIGRRDVLGLGATTKSIAGGMAADLPGMMAGFILGLADNPTLKSKIAMGLNNIKKLDVGDAQKRVMAIELLRTTGAAEDQFDESRQLNAL